MRLSRPPMAYIFVGLAGGGASRARRTSSAHAVPSVRPTDGASLVRSVVTVRIVP